MRRELATVSVADVLRDTLRAAHERGALPGCRSRQYTLRPGQRDVLIGLFDREFVESQEAA
jgi:hypothetical protein